ncbi:protein-L-isoaspartate(D-aspartate) O-methyltransferase [Pandoraea sp. XJJ-1]|uniref:protein-L-isoaspartate(D-aspartate) O-methyltransferase n=1 Tax=unclassified Pandoraea TaxID=2624094 RepID=UPI00095E1EDD|nr:MULTISPECIES: protein-L-isoaspartate(D-aspartate) O-methyltransferase [unclassified Pandoraea]OJY19568.1 MAG: protein-L-isoaspartate O-methyltransferase [Pandoraea sp. 64-18]WAL84549.1 protein-L-isoaspartate(D-aspartate) O-methyltransferase [Pandoraea sp. XJJ-1]
MTTPPKRFPLPLADVMSRRQRQAPVLDKASRASPAGAPPAAMTRAAAPASQGNGKTPTGGNLSPNTHGGLRAAATPMAGASARPGGAQTPHAVVPKGLARPASAPHAQPAPHAAKGAPRPTVKTAGTGHAQPGAAVGARGAVRGVTATKVSAGGTGRASASALGISPDGIGLTSERVRARMAERVAASGVKHPGVLAALATVPRHGFVDAALANQAYEDAALPIGHGQTISKPSVVGRMIELLLAGGRPLEKVLEIGTGCGYQAAVLSCVARDVYSIERVRPLHERAKANLRPLRVPNIRLHYGDGRLGLPTVAPFDGIVIAAAGLEIPDALIDQLAVGARLIAPVGGEQQILTLIERTGTRQWRETQLDRVLFVPLKSGII